MMKWDGAFIEASRRAFVNNRLSVMRTTFKHVVDIIIDTVEWCVVISSYYKNPYEQYQNVSRLEILRCILLGVTVCLRYKVFANLQTYWYVCFSISKNITMDFVYVIWNRKMCRIYHHLFENIK